MCRCIVDYRKTVLRLITLENLRPKSNVDYKTENHGTIIFFIE